MRGSETSIYRYEARNLQPLDCKLRCCITMFSLFLSFHYYFVLTILWFSQFFGWFSQFFGWFSQFFVLHYSLFFTILWSSLFFGFHYSFVFTIICFSLFFRFHYCSFGFHFSSVFTGPRFFQSNVCNSDAYGECVKHFVKATPT